MSTFTSVYTGETSFNLINSTNNGSLTNGSTSIPYVNLSGNLFIGAQYTNLLANCNIALFQFYNRVLSATEISQNFQTDKTRFGL